MSLSTPVVILAHLVDIARRYIGNLYILERGETDVEASQNTLFLVLPDVSAVLIAFFSGQLAYN